MAVGIIQSSLRRFLFLFIFPILSTHGEICNSGPRVVSSNPVQNKKKLSSKFKKNIFSWKISISQQKQVAIGWTLEIDKIQSKIGTIEKQMNKIRWSRQKTNEIFIDLGFFSNTQNSSKNWKIAFLTKTVPFAYFGLWSMFEFDLVDHRQKKWETQARVTIRRRLSVIKTTYRFRSYKFTYTSLNWSF